MNASLVATIGKVAKVQSGFAFKSRDWQKHGVPVIKIQNVRGGWVNLAGCSYVSDEVAAVASRFRLHRGDVLVTMSGEIGSIGVVRTDSHVLLNQRVGRLQLVDAKAADLGYLSYVLQDPALKATMEAIAYGAAQPNISPALIASLPIWLPPKPTQRKVAAVLEVIDDLIENNQRRVEVLEEVARAIYHEWFVKFRYPGHEDVPLVDSPLGPIPEGWTCGKLDDLVRIVKDTIDPSTLDPDTPAVGLEHIPRKQITLDDWGYAKDQGSRKAVFSKGDVLFGRIRPYFHKVSVAPIDGICSTDAIVIRPNEHHWGEAVLVLSSEEYVAHATQTSNGTKMPRADWKVIGQWPVAIPSPGLAAEFTGIIVDQLNLAEKLMLENRHLSMLRDLLLPKLVTGQIDVSKLDVDGLLGEMVA